MPKAFCVLEMCAKNLRELCVLCERKNVLCERKNSAASLIGLISYRGCVLFLTEKHRRTEHTAFHRDIKSTDFTEPYSQQRPHPQPLSEWRGEWLPRLPLHVLQMFSSLSPSISRPKEVTSHTNYQLSPPPTPPPKERGMITEIPPMVNHQHLTIIT